MSEAVVGGAAVGGAGSWEELVSAALVGTDRRPYDGDLLADAAVEVLRRRAGQRPAPEPAADRFAPEPASDGFAPGLAVGGVVPERAAGGGTSERVAGEVAEPEELPGVGGAAARRLTRILGGEHERLLGEWLRLAAAARRHVPAHVLPELLERGRRDRSIRGRLGVVAGRRGRWLAGCNPDWGYLLDEPTGADWEFGRPADRLAHLRRLRAERPGAARDLLARSWEQEAPDDRAVFVGALADGLSADDEEFLESVLDDRRREVRQEAAGLLARLPSSRLAARMAERALACVRLPRGGRAIEVVPPETCDPGMRRDGIRPHPPRGVGERAWWLQQVVSRTPLAVWGDPGAVLAAPLDEWEGEVRSGWVRAAVSQRHPEWARALFALDPIADLLDVLPAGERQELAAGFVTRKEMDSQLIMVLGGVERPWRDALAAAVLNKIVKVAATQPWNLGELATLAGERIDPSLHYLATSAPCLRDVATLLRFRAEMSKELT
ncbi:DUF5691 domain-containing protein [Nonomuraea longicatena]|uniref:DUF5691 domain-containing protein n=1 Tax=Nonomuraea longicatena TaxID=83682 RepID=A0ABP3Z494_9ACTN